MHDLHKSRINFFVEDTPYMRVFMEAKDLSDFQKEVIRDKIMISGEKERFISAIEGVSKIRQGMNAFYGEDTGIYNLIEDTFYEHEKCGLIGIEFLKITNPHLALKRNSPYREILRVK